MLLVEPVRVGCSERPAAKPLKLGMLEHAGNNELPQPVSAVLDLDVDGAVVAGHKIPDNDDDPKAIAETPNISGISSVSIGRPTLRASCSTR